MYYAVVQTKKDKLSKKNPLEMPKVRTASINSARILLSDFTDTIYTFFPADIDHIELWPVKESEG